MRLNLNWGGIYTNQEGFQHLLSLYNAIRSCQDPICEIDMSKIFWIDANMCAPFGALFRSYFSFPNSRNKRINLLDINDDVENILEKNGFLSELCIGSQKKPDTFKTVIEYRSFNSSDSILFKEYVENHFIKKHIGGHIPEMNDALKKMFRQSIFEIFENAVYHSKTRLGIFACGQYFPNKELLKFSIADLGIGMRRNLYECLNLDYAPESAISWALNGHNTTRQPIDGTPGGLGLKLIKNFIYKNGGEIMIISDKGYWSFKHRREDLKPLLFAFPGTAVNIIIHTKGGAGSSMLEEPVLGDVF